MDSTFLNQQVDSKTIPRLGRSAPPTAKPALPTFAEEERGSVAPEPELQPEPVEAPTTGARQTVCPKCQSKLADPEGLGWCMKCGYCRATDDAQSSLAARAAPNLAPPGPSFMGVQELYQHFLRIPTCLYLGLLGIATVVFVAYCGEMQTVDGSRGRALWTTTQVALGLCAMLGAQVWAAILVAPIDDKIGIRDAIIPFRLWAMAFKRLPQTGLPMCIASWGLTAVLSALIVIGGLDYWLPEKPKQKTELRNKAVPTVVAVMR